jgi:molybdate transport system ATP-binding protein
MADEATDQTPRIAGVVYSGDTRIEPLLAELRDRLVARGSLRLGGVVPRFGGLLANGRREMLLDDLHGGGAISISQELGPGAESCILDVDGLTRARLVILTAIDAGVDLVLAGKFAKQEAAGHGVREEIGAAMVADIPTLVVLREDRLGVWVDFVGDDWQRLPPDVDAILAWVDRAIAAPANHPD